MYTYIILRGSYTLDLEVKVSAIIVYVCNKITGTLSRLVEPITGEYVVCRSYRTI